LASGVIRKRAGVATYAHWCHTFRKNSENDWIATGFSFHVVVDWMGHSDEVARQHYLRVNDNDLALAAQSRIPNEVTQKVMQIAKMSRGAAKAARDERLKPRQS
jgi:integrase